MQIFLSKKKRGEHLDQMLCPEVLAQTPITMRTTLRAVGSLYDLSGKFLSPAQMKGRSLYSQVTKFQTGWDSDVKLQSEELFGKITSFLEELMEIQNHLDAMPRAWVPADHDLKNTIFSHDGSIEGYSGVCHARSQSNNDQSFCSRIACAQGGILFRLCGNLRDRPSISTEIKNKDNYRKCI